MTLDALNDLFAVADHLDWMRWASCAEVEPDLFFPEAGSPGTAAKKVCARCPVRSQCLQAAVEQGEEFGVWGGLTAAERNELQRFGLAA